ncbi:hypothetical protein NPIL_685761 [Nephila pilipes]|uniref:Uncharacterized protein n=1 Tax=Nephila pilipes TaxID=299642 RepID=A0A8X6J8A5_NEPPI|nr:hypothetical protein NPIL_685761 [Nephila pilipes]
MGSVSWNKAANSMYQPESREVKRFFVLSLRGPVNHSEVPPLKVSRCENKGFSGWGTHTITYLVHNIALKYSRGEVNVAAE